MQQSRWRYALAMLWITAVWGSTFVISKELITSLAPLNYLSTRFLLATLLFLLLFPRTLYTMEREAVRGGVFLGLFLSVGFITQSAGLLYTTPSKSAYVTGVAVILVPFLGYLLERVEVTVEHVISVFLAATGFALLTLPESNTGVNLGDLLTFTGTLFWALHIVYTGIFARRASTRQLTLIQFVASTCI
ncbi:MAG: EamA family transporter, partial [Candidatus Bathyarchaeia archaeon]